MVAPVNAKLFMAVATATAMLTDGDAAFLRVDNRRPPHALEPGVVWKAKNKRFDDGKPGPRFGIGLDPWGKVGQNLVSVRAWNAGPTVLQNQAGEFHIVVTGFVVGAEYQLRLGNAFSLSTERSDLGGGDYYVAGTELTSDQKFIATQDTYYLWASSDVSGAAVTANIRGQFRSCAYARFNDPTTDTDNGILLTDEWRADGGRGRCWRIQSNNAPQEISLNGQSVWGRAHLIQCHNALVLLREGNERHYFSAANVDGANDQLELLGAPSWGVGSARRVRFELAQSGSAIYGDAPPAPGNYYYAKRTSGNLIELYTDAGLNNQLDLTDDPAPIGRFYLELAVDPLPFFGNAAPPLILQPGEAGQLPFDAGWTAVAGSVAITNTDSNVIYAPNHRLAPGDSVSAEANSLKVTEGPDTYVEWPKYAAPQSAHTLRLYDSADAALADDGTTNLQAVLDGQDGIALYKTGAAGLPMPGGRAGCYAGGRLWIINGDDEVLFSDPFDFLHFSRFTSHVPANQGEAGRANWLAPLGEDVLIIGKEQKLIALAGIGGAVNTWREGTLTDEYGGIAPWAVVSAGTDLQFASRKGWASAVRTIAGERLAVPRTVSHAIPQYLIDIDWSQAAGMCAATWGGRLFWAVPTKGQTDPVNNRVLVLNFDNGQLYLEQAAVAGEIVGGVRQYAEGTRGVDSWEGEWTGDLLTPFAFCRLTVNGEERLTFATPDGLVCWFHDGWDDAGTAIADEVITRGYFGSKEVLATKGVLRWETFQPKISAYIRTAGYNEEEALAGFAQLEYNREQYLVDGQDAYDPHTSTTETFDAPHRADYSPSPEELLVARLDVHQTLSEPFRCRVRDHALQLRVVNEQGSLRLCSVSVQAKPVGISATRKT